MNSLLKYLIVGSLAACFSISEGYSGDAPQPNPYFSARLDLYAQSSKLAKGKWVKMKIEKNGVYKITFDKLRSLGFKQPENVRVFGYGGNKLSEKLNSDYNDDLPEVNTYVGDSYLIFYAVGPLKWEPLKWYADDDFPFSFTKNVYADYGCYFLSDVEGERKGIDWADEFESSEDPTDIFTHYSPSIYLPEKVNIYNGGDVWYDQAIVASGSKHVSFPFSNMVEGNDGLLRMNFYVPDSYKQNYKFNVYNSSFSKDLISGNVSSISDIEQSASARGLDFNFKFTSNLSTANSYIQYVLASALCENKLDKGYLFFNNRTKDKKYEVGNFVVANAGANTQVWSINDPLNVRKIKTKLVDDTIRFMADGSSFSQLVAFNPNGNLLAVDSFFTVDNQDLHSLKGADLVIVSPKAYFPQAQQLADYHNQYDGISSIIVSQEQIFNEFSSGTPDPTAIRSFMKMMYDRAVNDDSYIKPRYLLLFGDGCYDNKGILRTGTTIARNLVLTYQTGVGTSNYVVDDYYGFLADNVTTGFSLDSCVCHVAVGRLPFTNATQATQVVEKMGRYMRENNYGKWKTNVMILADDNEASESAMKGSSSSYHEFVNYAESLSSVITNACPAMAQNKVYYDSYTRVAESNGFRYPEVEKKIVDNVSKGVMFINYIGHSNAINWSAEKTFTQSQISNFSNKNLGVWFSASCDFSEFDGYTTSCGEALVLAPNGGALAVVATPRQTYSSQNNKMDTAVSRAFFSQTPDMTIGDIVKNAKNNVKENIRVKYPLMGDPAIHVHFPSMNVVTDSMSSDTIKAMSRVFVRGHIEDNENSVSNFNGRICISVYDKKQSRSTKGNLLNMVTSFYDYVNTLYVGETDVVDGKFSFEFLVPNGISYNYGFGRIAYYAYDKDNNYEAIGNYSNFYVGGSSDTDFNDSVGPDINAYINTASFRSGDVVGANPVLVAELHDENGINASGIGIGHDITVSLNGADNVVVNDYFVYNKDSYTDGKLVYPLSDLPDGIYTLNVKSWDMLGNSSLSTIAFRVKNSRDPHIDDIVAVSTPAKESTTLKVKYDRLLTNVSYNVYIYSMNGVLINQMKGSDYSSDGEISIDWDLTDSRGVRVQPGVYIYRVDLKVDGSPYVGASEKIIVLPQ